MQFTNPASTKNMTTLHLRKSIDRLPLRFDFLLILHEQDAKAQRHEALIARQQQQIEALAATVQKVSDQLDLNKTAPQPTISNQLNRQSEGFSQLEPSCGSRLRTEISQNAPLLSYWARSEDRVITTLKPAVREAGQHGADAVIVIAQDVETRGYSTMSFANANSNTSFSGVAYGNGIFTGNANTTANAFGSSFTTPIRRGQARVLAIKFI